MSKAQTALVGEEDKRQRLIFGPTMTTPEANGSDGSNEDKTSSVVTNRLCCYGDTMRGENSVRSSGEAMGSESRNFKPLQH